MSDIHIKSSQQISLHRSGGQTLPVQNQTQEQHLLQTEEQPPKLSESARKQLFESQRKLTVTNQPDPDTQTLVNHIEEIPQRELNQNVQQVPPPQRLEQVRNQVERAQTLPLNPVVQEQLAPTLPPRNFAPEDLNLGHPDLGLSRHEYKVALGQLDGGNPREALKRILAQELKPYLRELSRFDKLGNRSHTQQQQISDDLKTHLQNLLKGTGKKDELSLLLDMYPGNKLKPILAEVVGELREGKSRNYDQLSAKKQLLVDKALDGIRSGKSYSRRKDFGLIPNKLDEEGQPVPKPPCALLKAQEHLLTSLKNHLSSNLNEAQVLQLRSKSKEDLMTDFQPYLGNLGGSLQDLVWQAVQTFTLPTKPRQQESFVKDLAPQDLLGEGVGESLLHLVAHPGSEDARAQVMAALGRHLQSLDPEHNTLWQLSIRSKSELGDLLQGLAGHPPGSQQVPPLSPEDVDELVKGLRSLLPHRTGENMVDCEGRQVPEKLILNGEEYLPRKFIAEAGFGYVVAYQNVRDEQDQVAVKILLPNTDVEKEHQAAVRELNLHRELQGPDGHPGVIQLKGAVHAPDDSLCMVMENAPNKDLFVLSQRLDQEVQAGRMTREERQLVGLSLFKQALESVAYLHDDREMLHSDLKSSNLMLDKDLKVKMIDFGTAFVGPERNIDGLLVDNPIYQAPEQMGSKNSTTFATSKSDMWSMGTLAFELLVGPVGSHPFFDSSNNRSQIDTSNDLKTFALDHQNRFLSYLPQGMQLDPAVKELVESLMAPLPEQRLSARQTLALPLLQDPRLESQPVKDLLKSLFPENQA